jgi:excinuclease ABC subunit C
LSTELRAHIKSLSGSPGVYRFLNAKGELLYVGKARNLKKRVTSYFRTSGLSPRIHAMMQTVSQVEVTVTHTEGEALLLENNLIKSLRPRYNVLLRDDKSYPYIYLAEDHPFPRITFHRGAKRGKGRYFGPFPSAGAVRESLQLLQKMFPVRQCEDTVYRNRSRPCLQFQIKRCSAPCVGLIDEAAYREDVRLAILFLEGRSQALTDELAAKMEQASAQQDYERAALLRDRIATLGRIQERQYVSGEGGDADVLAVATDANAACMVVTYIRDGRNLGNKVFFPKLVGEATREEVLSAFLPQYYLDKPTPAAIYVNGAVADRALLEQTLTAQQGGKRVHIVSNPRGAPRRWVQMAQINAEDALRRQLASQASLRARFESLQEALGLDGLPERIECFDVSHTQGEATVASCVVFDQNGPVKSDYRRFNIEGVAAGDDYGALQQALTRRYQRLKEGEGRLPDLLLIDGGRGQLHVAEVVLQELQVEGVKLVGVAKGPERKPGKEQLFLSGTDEPTILPADSAGLHLIQQVRDEAHRFAITGHRQRRAKVRVTSSLEQIPGIGKKRRQALLQQLGGLQSVARAGIEDLMRVPGISPALAQRIYDTFHEANQ